MVATHWIVNVLIYPRKYISLCLQNGIDAPKDGIQRHHDQVFDLSVCPFVFGTKTLTLALTFES